MSQCSPIEFDWSYEYTGPVLVLVLWGKINKCTGQAGKYTQD